MSGVRGLHGRTERGVLAQREQDAHHSLQYPAGTAPQTHPPVHAHHPRLGQLEGIAPHGLHSTAQHSTAQSGRSTARHSSSQLGAAQRSSGNWCCACSPQEVSLFPAAALQLAAGAQPCHRIPPNPHATESESDTCSMSRHSSTTRGSAVPAVISATVPAGGGKHTGELWWLSSTRRVERQYCHVPALYVKSAAPARLHHDPMGQWPLAQILPRDFTRGASA